MASNKEEIIAVGREWRDGSSSWIFVFRRPSFDWEITMYDEFMERIGDVVPSLDGDSLSWVGDANGIFTVKEVCKVVELKVLGPPL